MGTQHIMNLRYLEAWENQPLIRASVLDNQRGLIWFLEFLFAIIAIILCTTFQTSTGYQIGCKVEHQLTANTNETLNGFVYVFHKIYYPFRLDHNPADIINNNTFAESECFDVSKAQNQPGDFYKSAQFFVTVGVFSLMVTAGHLYYYGIRGETFKLQLQRPFNFWSTTTLSLFMPSLPLLMTFFWFVSTCVWTNAVFIMKKASNANLWLHYSRYSPCQKNGTLFMRPTIYLCDADYGEVLEGVNEFDESDFKGSYGSAHASILFGLFNFFLWTFYSWNITQESRKTTDGNHLDSSRKTSDVEQSAYDAI